MIEQINTVNRVYGNETVLHTYKTTIDPKTLKATNEHLICRIYDKQAQVKDFKFKHNIDKLA